MAEWATVSKYPVIKAELKSALLEGRFRDGEPLPSEAQLAKTYSVSRMTARRALDELEREGYITRVQGAGSYPTGRRFAQGRFRVRPLEELAARASKVPHEATVFTRVLEAALGRADRSEAEALGLETGSTVILVSRLRGLETPHGQQALILERRAVRLEAEALLRMDLTAESLHDQLVALGFLISRVEQTLEAVVAPPEAAQRLGVPAQAAVFLLSRTSVSSGGPLLFARYWVRGDAGVFANAFSP